MPPPRYRIHGPGQEPSDDSWLPPGVGVANGATKPYRGGFKAEQERQAALEERRRRDRESEASGAAKGSQGVDAAPTGPLSTSTELVAFNPASNDDVHMTLQRSQPFAAYSASRLLFDESYAALLGAALSGDTLSCICNLVGLKHFHVMARVCTAWHDAICAKMREWGVLTYVRAMGKGFGKMRGQFDMPTWLTLLPEGELCVVDSCNYRLQIVKPSDGSVSRIVGRPGAKAGQLSSPSSVAYSPSCGPRKVFATSNVGPEDRRVMAFDLKTWELEKATPEGTGRTELDAPEGMAVEDGKIFVVDTANHRLVAFDIHTLAKVGTYPPASWARTGRCRQGKAWDQLNCPQDIAAHECELFVSDTHNDRIQVFNTSLEWIGVIGCRGRGAGQFVYPRGVAVAGVTAKLLYVCEEQRIQALTLLGEPRIVLPVPGAGTLCGIVCDGERRVYCTDMDTHVIHVLRLTHSERWQEKRREAILEAKLRKLLRGERAVEDDGEEEKAEQERREKRDQARTEQERQRDRAVMAVLTGTDVRQMLGLPQTANEAQIRQAIRLAMRLLHPDRSLNYALKGTPEQARLEAAFKKVNNMKDVERIESWMDFSHKL